MPRFSLFLSFFFNFTQAVKREEEIAESHPSEVVTYILSTVLYGPHGWDLSPQLVASEWPQTKYTYVAGISRRRMSAAMSNFCRRLRRNQPDNQLLHCVPSVRGIGALEWPENSAACGLDLNYRQQLYITIGSMHRHMQSLPQVFPQPFDNLATMVEGH